jgi:tRNA1Val (adenine37-N6)-methyltransferase
VAEVKSSSSSSSSSSSWSTTVTHDALFNGAVSLKQPSKSSGYRVNVDALLLAAFAARALEGGSQDRRRVKHAIDLGSGVGAVALSLLHLDGAARVTMIEIDETLADLATTNAADNDWSDRAVVIHASVSDKTKTKDLAGTADLVVCNPPYVTPGRGRVPSERVKNAKYGDLASFITAARRVAGRRARVCFIYPAIEATNLLTHLRSAGLEPKRLRAVHGKSTDGARVLLVECAASAKPGGLMIEPPFVEMHGRTRSPALINLLALG